MPDKTGKLVSIGRQQLGYATIEHYKCVDCETTYPASSSDAIAVCNSIEIDLCPYCRPDSKPFTHGRGL